MNYTVTRDVIELLNDGPAWIVGEGHSFPTGQADHRCAVCGFPPEQHPAPPADFLAATEPCATCKGTAVLITDVLLTDGSFWETKDCPDCHNGKPRLNMMVGCPECEFSDFLCGQCDDGLVHAATVTAVGKVVPIIAWDDQKAVASLDEFIAIGSPTDPTWRAHYKRGDDIGRSITRQITLPANANPGMFALQVEKVSE